MVTRILISFIAFATLTSAQAQMPAGKMRPTDDQRRQLATANSREAQDALLIKWGLKKVDDLNGSLETTIDKYQSATSDKERAPLASTLKTYFYISDSDAEKQMIRQVFVEHPASTETSTASSSGVSRAPASTGAR